MCSVDAIWLSEAERERRKEEKAMDLFSQSALGPKSLCNIAKSRIRCPREAQTGEEEERRKKESAAAAAAAAAAAHPSDYAAVVLLASMRERER